MTEPQLSAEGKLNILELVDPKVPYSHFVRVLEKYTQEVIATALEEQRVILQKVVSQQLLSTSLTARECEKIMNAVFPNGKE